MMPHCASNTESPSSNMYLFVSAVSITPSRGSRIEVSWCPSHWVTQTAVFSKFPGSSVFTFYVVVLTELNTTKTKLCVEKQTDIYMQLTQPPPPQKKRTHKMLICQMPLLTIFPVTFLLPKLSANFSDHSVCTHSLVHSAPVERVVEEVALDTAVPPESTS